MTQYRAVQVHNESDPNTLKATVYQTGFYQLHATMVGKRASDLQGEIPRLNNNSYLLTEVGIALPAGSAIIGKVGIDQTTPGTTNGVQVTAALPAGSNLIGNVDVASIAAGDNNIGNVDVLSTVGVTNRSSFGCLAASCAAANTAYNPFSQAIPAGFSAVLQAKPQNTGLIYFAVNAAAVLIDTFRGELSPGDSVKLKITNANLLYIAASVAGDGVRFIAEI